MTKYRIIHSALNTVLKNPIAAKQLSNYYYLHFSFNLLLRNVLLSLHRFEIEWLSIAMPCLLSLPTRLTFLCLYFQRNVVFSLFLFPFPCPLSLSLSSISRTRSALCFFFRVKEYVSSYMIWIVEHLPWFRWIIFILPLVAAIVLALNAYSPASSNIRYMVYFAFDRLVIFLFQCTNQWFLHLCMCSLLLLHFFSFLLFCSLYFTLNATIPFGSEIVPHIVLSFFRLANINERARAQKLPFKMWSKPTTLPCTLQWEWVS